MKSPTFKDEGYRRIKCPNPKCGKVLGRKDKGAVFTRLGDTKTRYYTCCHCGHKIIVQPPIRTNDEQRLKVILWGPNMTPTADLTDEECNDTIPAEA